MTFPRVSLLAVALCSMVPPAVHSQAPMPAPVVTTIYVVRHAEKLNNTADPPLSPAGTARAKELAHVLKDAKITAIFVTELQRTRLTAKPLTIATGLTPITYPAATPATAVTQILANHAGGRILVVAHSNTVDDIASGLGVTGIAELAEPQFDRFFAIQRVGGTARLQRLRYGVGTP